MSKKKFCRKGNEKVHLNNIDIIKIFAAILIVFHHYQQISGVIFQGINFYNGRFAFGYLVELFFLISGFLTVYRDSEKDKQYLKCFINKAIRVYPSAFLSVIILLITTYVYYFRFGEWIFGERYTFYNVIASLLLFHQGGVVDILPAINNPTWYLCVLLICYVVFYVIKCMAGKLNFHSRWIVYLIMVFMSVVGIKMGFEVPFFRFTTQRGYCSFFIGGLLCELYWMMPDNILKYTRNIVCAFSFLAIVTQKYSKYMVLVFLIYPSVLLCMISTKQLNNKYISYLSRSSFQVYLWHVPMYAIYKFLFRCITVSITHTYLTMTLFLISVEIVALWIYRYYEIPISGKFRIK